MKKELTNALEMQNQMQNQSQQLKTLFISMLGFISGIGIQNIKLHGLLLAELVFVLIVILIAKKCETKKTWKKYIKYDIVKKANAKFQKGDNGIFYALIFVRALLFSQPILFGMQYMPMFTTLFILCAMTLEKPENANTLFKKAIVYTCDLFANANTVLGVYLLPIISMIFVCGLYFAYLQTPAIQNIVNIAILVITGEGKVGSVLSSITEFFKKAAK